MSLRPEPIGEIPSETVRVARAAFPRGNPYLRLRDELGTVFRDEDFADLFPRRGQPALPPWRLALVTVLQFRENLSDRQAADAVRARIDWKYLLGLELTDPGFDASVLCEFRARLLKGGAEERVNQGGTGTRDQRAIGTHTGGRGRARRSRASGERRANDQARFLKRQLSLPVSRMSQ